MVAMNRAPERKLRDEVDDRLRGEVDAIVDFFADSFKFQECCQIDVRTIIMVARKERLHLFIC